MSEFGFRHGTWGRDGQTEDLWSLPWRLAGADPVAAHGTDGDDVFTGTDANERYLALGGNDTLSGAGGRDHLFGGHGDDIIDGGDGNDVLRGGAGHDLMRGGAGDDKIVADGGGDKFYGDGGNDFLLGEYSSLFGGEGTDTLVGVECRMSGGAGDDLLQPYDSFLIDDHSHLISGGSGADTFVFCSTESSALYLGGGSEEIQDLSSVDTVDLSQLDADSVRGGQQFFHLVEEFDGNPGEITVTYDDQSNRTEISLYTNKDLVPDAVIWTMGDHTDFTNFVFHG